MAWGIFKLYGFFQSMRTPKFLKILFKNIYLILTQVFLSVGQGYLDSLQSEIIRIGKLNLSGEEKFKLVFKFAKGTAPKLKDSYINLLIETLVAKLKQGRTI